MNRQGWLPSLYHLGCTRRGCLQCVAVADVQWNGRLLCINAWFQGLCGIDPLTTLADTRTAIGLPCDPDDLALADVRRVLMAASTPAFLRTENDPVYLKAALGTLERLLAGFFG